MANVTATTAALLIDEHWDSELNGAVQFDLVLDKMFTDKSSSLPSGDTLHRPASHNLTAQTKSASTAVTPEAVTETEQTFVVSTHQIVAQEIEDFAAVQSKYDIRAEYTKHAAYALARARDVACANLLDDNTVQTVGVLGSEVTADNLLSARAYLRNIAAPPPYKGAVSPATYNGFLKIDQFVNSGDYGANSDAITAAHLGKAYNFDFYESQLLVGTAPNSSGCVWAGDHFFKIIQKAPKYDAWYSPFDKAWCVAADQIYGVFENQEADEAAVATTTARLYNVRLQSKK